MNGVETGTNVLHRVEVIDRVFVYLAEVDDWPPFSVLLPYAEDGTVVSTPGCFDEIPLKEFLNVLFDDLLMSQGDLERFCEDGRIVIQVDAV